MPRKAATRSTACRRPCGRLTPDATAGRGAWLSASPPLLIAAAAAVLVIISSIFPWARVSTEAYVGAGVGAGARAVTVSGTAVDGWITLVLGAIATGLLGWRLARPKLTGYALAVSLVLLVTSGVVATTNLLDVGYATGDFNVATLPAAEPGFIRTGISVAWGLVVTTSASWAGAAAAAYQLWKEHFN